MSTSLITPKADSRVYRKDPMIIAVKHDPTFSFTQDWFPSIRLIIVTHCVLQWGWELWFSTTVMIIWDKKMQKCWPVNKGQMEKKTQSQHHSIHVQVLVYLFRCVCVFFVIHQLDSCIIPNMIFLLFVSICFTKVAVFKVFGLKAAAWTHIPNFFPI